MPDTSDRSDTGNRRDAGYGVFLGIGTFVGLAGGLVVSEPSLGVVLGLAVGGMLALALRLRRSGGRPR